MPNPTRLLHRQPKIDPARVEIARSITMARLTSLFDPDSLEEGAPDEGDATVAVAFAPAEPVEFTEAVASVEPVAAVERVAAPELEAMEPAPAVEHTPLPETAFAAVDAMDLEPDASRNGRESTVSADAAIASDATDDELTADDDMAAVSPTAEPETVAPSEHQAPMNGYAPDLRTDPFGWDLPASVTNQADRADPTEALTSAGDDATAVPVDVAPPEAAPSPPKRPQRVPRPATSRPRPVAARGPDASAHAGPVAVIATCPYCALLLEPPPTADRRCTRCRQRIVVRRAHGRAVYLTEAAVEVFESERRRVANTGRWTRDRERWLKLAGSVQAPAARIARLERALLSDEVVASARALYETTVERLVRTARRGRRWDDVARLRRDQALALHRAAGSPSPPLDEIAALHREGALAGLRGIGEIAREAALVGVDCCDHCRADVGRKFRISVELREPRLPHAGCPAGLCRCHWELTARDRDVIGGYLRRHARPDRVAPPA